MHSYSRLHLWIYSIISNLLLLSLPMSTSAFTRPSYKFQLLSRLRIPLYTGASASLSWTCLNCHNRCDSILSYIATNIRQHMYFHNIYLLSMSSFCRPTYCTIQHTWLTIILWNLPFSFWDPLVTQNVRCLTPLHPHCLIL